MSIDQQTKALFERVQAQAKARGLRIISAANPDGRGWRFAYAPIKPARVASEASSRRGTAAEAQGSLL